MDALTAPVSSNLGASRLSSWSPHGILTLGRRNTMLLKMQTGKMPPRLRHSHGIRAHKGVHNQPADPDPEDECKAAKHKNFNEKLKEHCEKKFKGYCVDPPDMPFREEQDRIYEYLRKMAFCNTSILHQDSTGLSLLLCMIADKSVMLASMVVACAALRPGKAGKISLDTMKQTVRMYVCTFVSTAEDTYHEKVNKETFVSFLGALEGVAAMSHILLQDTLENLNDNEDSSWNYSPDCDISRARREFQWKMNSLKHKFMAASNDTYELIKPTMLDAIKCTQSFVILMTCNCERALDHVPGACIKKRTNDESTG